MDIRDIVANFESGDDFSELSYEAQMMLRASNYYEAFNADPEYRALSPEAKQYFLEPFITAAPKFKDKRLEYQAQFADKLFESKDKELIDELEQQLMPAATTKNSVLAWLAGKTVEGIIYASNELTKPKRIAYTNGKNRYDEYKKRKAAVEWTDAAIFGPESTKLTEYYTQIASRDKWLKQYFGEQTAILSTGAFITDLYAMYGNPLTKSITGIKQIDATGKIIEKSGLIQRTTQAMHLKAKTKVGQWLAGTVLMDASKISTEALIGVVREDLLSWTKGEFKDMDSKEIFEKQLKTFGDYAVYDYAIWAAGQVLSPLGKVIGKSFVKSKFEKAIPFGLSSAEFKKVKEAIISGDLPKELKGLVDEGYTDHIIMNEQVKSAFKMGKEIKDNPFMQAVKTGAYTGHSIIEISDDTYRIRNIHDYNQVKVIKGMDNMLDEVGMLAANKAKSLKDMDPTEFIQANQWALNRVALPYNIDSKIDDISKRTKDFAAPSKTSWITQGEYAALKKEGKATIKSVSIDIDEIQMEKIKKGISIYGSDPEVFTAKGKNKNAVIVLNNPATYSQFNEISKRATDIKNAGDVRTIDQIKKAELLHNGFDGALLDEAGKEVYTLFPNKIKFLDIDNTISGIKKAPDALSAKVRLESKALLNKSALTSNEKAYISTLTNLKGSLDLNSLQKMSNYFLDGSGVSTKNINIKFSNNASGFVFKKKSGDITEIIVPNAINTPTARDNFVKTFMSTMNDIATERGGIKMSMTDAIAEFNTIKNQGKRIVYEVGNILDDKQKLAWVTDLVDKSDGFITKEGDKFVVKAYNGATEISVDTIDKALDAVLRSQVTPNQLKKALSLDGKTLEKVGLVWKVTEKGKLIGESSDIFNLMDTINYRPKIDNSLLPKLNFVEEGIEFTYTKDIVTGSNSKMRQFLAQFDDYTDRDVITQIFKDENGNIFKDVDNSFRIEHPGIGVIKNFDNLADAKKFLKEDWKKYSNLQEIAESKGLMLFMENGQYVLRDPNGSLSYKANTPEELGSVFKNQYPDSNGGIELVDEAFLQGYYRHGRIKTSNLKKPNIMTGLNKEETLSPMLHISQLGRRFSSFLYRAAEKTGNKDILKYVRKLEDGIRAYEGTKSRGEELLRSLFTENGSQIKRERRVGLLHYFEADDSMKASVIEKHKLTDRDIAIADETIGLLKELGPLFKIDIMKMIKHYVPHVRKYIPGSGRIRHLDGVGADDLVRRSFGENIPTEMTWFAQYQRTDDFVEGIMEEDALKVLLRYNDWGHKVLHMKQAWMDLDDYMKTHRKDIDNTIYERVNAYRARIMRIDSTDAEKQIMRAGEEFYKRLKPNDKEFQKKGKGILQYLFSANYLVNLGARPWPVIRNALSGMNMIGAQHGNDYLVKAVSHVVDNADEVVRAHTKIGLYSDTFTELLVDEDLINDLTHKSLKAFTRSEHLLRSISYVAAEMEAGDAVKRLKAGVFDKAKSKGFAFLVDSGMNKLDDDIIQSQIFPLISRGDFDTAISVYAKEMTDLNMIKFAARESAPIMSKGLIGKAFGQYQQFASGWVEYLKRGIFTRGTAGQRLAFGLRYAANTAAISYALTQAGMSNRDFSFVPTGFTGGPYFNLAVDSIRSMDSSRRGDVARRSMMKFWGINYDKREEQLKLSWPRYLPGYYQFKQLSEFIKYSEEDDGYRALLSLIGLPIDPEQE